MNCTHAAASPVFNASSVPVRLICPCGKEWRVVPLDALVTLNPTAVELVNAHRGGEGR